ncbi:MAG TPA: bifunctional oligoribonuclease/PAP phosphatase NrnA [Massilibacterium sp.]|nr:bifunctional oligoribonuclease/PAP phosphatase NrnA [Massilibacterium sp.]
MKQQILDAIKQHNTIIIHRHVRPDPDALGSQGGLKELIQTTFPKKQVYIVGEENPQLTFLTKMDHIQDDVFKEALVIVCDTANQERVDDSRYETGKMIIKIDHHPNREPFGDICWVDTEASSTSELIYELYLHGAKQGYTLSNEGARLLYAGIVADTGRFLFPNATNRTFQYAGELIAYSFNRKALYDDLYRTPLHVVKLQGYILQNVTLSSEGVAFVSLTKSLMDEYNVTTFEASQLISSLGNIDGILAWVFFVEEEDKIRVRLRSKGPTINTIAEKYNGGGHPLASGATIYTWEDVEKVVNDLKQVANEYRKSMTF